MANSINELCAQERHTGSGQIRCHNGGPEQSAQHHTKNNTGTKANERTARAMVVTQPHYERVGRQIFALSAQFVIRLIILGMSHPANKSMPESVARRMWIALQVGFLVMKSVDTNPGDGRAHQAQVPP